MPSATLDVDPDVFAAVGRIFLASNDAVCDIVAAAADAANSGRGMAGVDSTGAAWARDYDAAASELLRAGSTVVDALGVVGDRLVAAGENHDAAETASIPQGGVGPPTYSGSPGTTRAVGVVVSEPPSADGTPSDPPAGWSLIAHLIAYTWPAGHPDQLRAVATGWLTAGLSLSDEADRLSGPIGELAGQRSPEVPYALATCTGLQTAVRTLADQYAVVAQVCAGYANHLDRAHRDVVAQLVELVVDEAVIEAVGALVSGPTGGTAQVPTQAVASARASAAALRVGRILAELAEEILTLENLVAGVTEQVLGVLVELQQVAAQRDTLQAVTALIDAGIPPVDLQANERDNPTAHVIEKHVAKSDAYLRSRNIPVASTFTSLAAATTAVSTVLAAHSATIADWLAGPEPSLVLFGPLPPDAGRTYLQESDRFIVPTRVRVTLVRKTHGYYIVTAFPEP